MSENFKKNTTERPDRTLGDEWAEWEGSAERSVESGKGLFLGFALTVFLLIDAVLGVLYYFILPRLEQFHSWLGPIAFWMFVIWAVLSTVFWVQLALTCSTGKNFFLAKKEVFLVFDLVFARVFKLARLLKISRDRMGHSFVLVSNSVVRAVDTSIGEKKVMILLPRCLTKEVLQEVYKLKEMFPIEIYTVSGGELARKKVKEVKPTAIIGVACERDLVSGIRDVAYRIPVIGIPNKRPDGPCKETIVDINELKKAVEFYLK